jgi:hypothetical protein
MYIVINIEGHDQGDSSEETTQYDSIKSLSFKGRVLRLYYLPD